METVERAVTLPTDLADAWDLLTCPEDQSGWLGAEVDLEPRPGAAGVVVDHDGTRRRLVVDRVDDQRSLTWRWWVDGDEASASEVQVRLAPTLDGTLVTVTERQLAPAGARASASASAPAQAAARAGGAWTLRLLHLEAILLFATVAARA
jgi:uncharacterized protein YndB with AHSA1/START domain